ncbi:MAG TPA: hypothetical protein VLZ07_04175 [Syntrophales bacterium]|nr:hypothetical protein [Syntrophales bacterium]
MADSLIKDNKYRFGLKNDWTITVANTQSLREEAFELVYKIYLGKGYALGPLGESGLWCTIHHLHPRTITFLATKDGRAAGTVSIVPDSRLGLPADIIFPDRLLQMRNAGRRLSEVFSLGVDEEIAHSAIDLTMHLYRLIHVVATRLFNNTDLVASVMAHHAPFYSKVLLFDEVSPESRQSPKTGEQVVFTRINLDTMEERYARRYGRMKGNRNLHRWFFENEEEKSLVDWIKRSRRPISADELKYFGKAKSRAFVDAGPDDVATLMKYRKEEAARKS